MASAKKKSPLSAIPVVTPSGKVGYLPPEVAQDAARQGVHEATDRQIRAEQLKANEVATEEATRKKFEGAGALAAIEGTIGPELAGAARGATLGLSDQAILSAAETIAGPSGREAVRNRLLDYQSYSPVRSFTSELGGAIGAAALTGGETAAAAAPEAGSALARGARSIAGMGLEGGVYGAGGAVSEAALKDEKLTAEALVGGFAHGVAGGVILGGLAHGAGAALRGMRGPKGSAAAYEALAGRQFGEAAPGIGREMAAAEGALSKVDDAAMKAGPYRAPEPAPRGGLFDDAAEAAIKVGTKGDEAKAGQAREFWTHRKAINEGAERIETHSRDITAAITEQQKAGRVTDMATFGDAKKNHMASLVSPSRFGEQSSLADAWAAEARARMESMIGDPNSGLSRASVERLDGHLRRIEAAKASGEGAKLFSALDDAKRFVGREAGFGRTPFGKSEAARAFEDLYQGEGGLMRALESEAWGKRASEAQRSVNAATHDWISTGDRFRQKFTTKYGDTAGVPDFVGNSEGVSSFMGRLTKAANDLDAQAFREAVQARRAYLDATGKGYDHGTAAVNAIAKERAALDKMETAFEQATKETSLINQFRAMQEQEQSQRIGGALGMFVDSVSKPATTLQRLAQLEAHTQALKSKLGMGTGELLGVAAKPQATTLGLAAPRGKGGPGFFTTLLDQTTKAERPAAVTGGVSESKRAQYERRSEALASLQANPQRVAVQIGDAMAPYAAVAPKVTSNATATATLALQFLYSKLPPNRRDEFSLQPQLQPKTRASDAEVSRFMRYMEAIDDPTVLLREAKTGTLTRDHVEAVQAVYPRLYEEMRGEVMRHLIDSKSPLPYGRRIQLGILLDLPTDKTLSPEFLTAIQATYTSEEKAGAESPPPNLSRPLEVAGTQQTAMQQAVARAQ
jgi:hypothetical protein